MRSRQEEKRNGNQGRLQAQRKEESVAKGNKPLNWAEEAVQGL
jgi:hypothetical protein